MNFYTNVSLNRGKILLRGYDNGRKVRQIIPFRPYLFMPSQGKTPTNFKSIFGQPVDRIDFESVWEARNWIREYKDVSGFTYMGMDKWQYVYIHDNYPSVIEYDQNLIRGLIFDIEVDTSPNEDGSNGMPDIQLANKVITSVAIGYKNQRILLSYRDYTPKAPNVKYIKCRDEEDLLKNFIHIWKTIDPDYVSGWNTPGFDIPYLAQRIINILGEDHAKSLSPWGELLTKEITSFGKNITTYIPLGIAVLDYLDLYKKFTYNQRDSYSLNNISHIELDEKKLDYSEYTSLHELYENNYEKFLDYNLQDIELIFRLDDKMKLFDLAFEMAYDAKVNYGDVFTTVHYWDVLVYNYLYDKNIVVPKYSKKLSREFEGAFVKEPVPRMYNWPVTFDLSALYPSIIRQYNIGPETFVKKIPGITVDKCLNEDLDIPDGFAMAANGCLYRKDIRSFSAELMDNTFEQRSYARKKLYERRKEKEQTSDKATLEILEKDISKYNNKQLAKKLQGNAYYGSFSNEGFRYYDANNAEAITLSGQLAIRWISRIFNKFLNKYANTTDHEYVFYGDTDSAVLSLDKIVDMHFDDQTDTQKILDFLSEFCENTLQPLINKSYEKLAKKMNAYENRMIMKREVIGNKGLWIAKKRYMINVLDDEGVRYKDPELKIMGVEVVRSSTPEICRNSLKEAIRIIMTDDLSVLRNFVDKFRKEYFESPFHEIAFPRGVNGLQTYSDSAKIYKLGTPIHTRAALLYNKVLKDRNLNKPQIFDGEKIKFCYLKMPNPIHENVIASHDIIPDDLNKFIDYNLMFEKSFLEPLQNIIRVLNWEIEETATLDGLF